MNGRQLTVEIAEQFLSDCDSVNLSAYDTIDEVAAEVLAKHPGTLDLSGLTSLSTTASKTISEHACDDWCKILAYDDNVFLRAAISLARALAVADRRTKDSEAADYEEMKSAVETIVRDAEMLDDIQRLATTIKNNGDKIITKSERLRRKLDDQIEQLQKHLAAVNTAS